MVINVKPKHVAYKTLSLILYHPLIDEKT